MSRIEQLIEELCPEGVEWKELGEVMSITRGASPRPINNFITNDKDGVPWIKIGDVNLKSKFITQTKEKITKEGAEKSRLLKKGDFVLSNSMSFGRPYILAIDGCIHDGWISMQNFENVLIADFLYYILSSDIAQNYWKQKASSGTVQNLNADIVRATKIPIPPLPIQQEIVNILDKFTALDASLQAELEARRKQYEHYRNQLLNFEGKEVEWKTLGEIIISLKTGLNPRKNFNLNTPDATNYYVTVRELNSFDVIFTDKTDRVNDTALKLINNRSNLDKGDILFSGTGTIGRTAYVKEKPTNWNIKEGVYVIKPNQSSIMSKFLLYLLKSENAIQQIENKIVGSPIRSIPMGEFKKIDIPIPSLEEQKRIISLIDSFEELVNNSLPAEIAARRKQYEYYREKLLTFEPLAN